MKRDLVIGIDCSTTAVKAVVWDLRGNALAEGRATYSLASPRDGWGEQDPIDWWHATLKAMRDACQKIDARRVAALSIAHQRETFACLGADGEAVRPAILWLDTRAKAEIASFGNESVHERTGKPPNTATSWYKLLWLKKHEPDALAKTRWIVDVQAYLVQRMTGQWRTSYGSVDPMGLLNLKTFTLDHELLALAGLEAGQIPEIHAPGERLGELSKDVAEAIGLLPGIPVISGTGDGQSASLGANITAAGGAFLNLGTGIVSGTFSQTYCWSNAFRTMSGAIPGTYSPETFIGGGAFNISWFVEKFFDVKTQSGSGDKTPEEILESAASQVVEGSEGLLHLPYLSGALAPYWDPNARGLYFGLSPKHGRAHFYRALLEGLAMEQRLATIGAEQALGAPIDSMRIMGGGSRSPLWSQILADVLKRPIELSREAETTCLGAGMMAAAGVGLHKDMRTAAAAMSGVAKIYLPNDSVSRTYDSFYAVYCDLYPKLKETFIKLQVAQNSRLAQS